MKKIILLVAALAATIATAFAEPESTKSHKQHFDFRDFTAISLSHSFQTELTFADTYSVDIEVPDFIEPYLKVSCLGGKLRIGLEKNLPRNILRKLNDHPGRLKAWITMPALSSIDMSGATCLTTIGTPRIVDGSLSIDMSGASELQSLNAQGGGHLSLDMSGASKATLDLTFASQDIDLSGASTLRLNGNSDKAVIDCSGASKCQLKGDYDILKAEISGSSGLTVDGDVRDLDIDASGASKFDIEGQTRKAEVELSGVSKGRLTIKEKMKYELSGVSTLKIKDLGATLRGEISRGAKIEYQK